MTSEELLASMRARDHDRDEERRKALQAVAEERERLLLTRIDAEASAKEAR